MTSHPAYPRLQEMAKKTGKNTFDILGERLQNKMTERKAETLSASNVADLLDLADMHQLT